MRTNSFFQGPRAFMTMLVGQAISVIGSGLSAFALGVWVYKTSGSVTQFAMVELAFWIPIILGSPIAGAIADRFNRRALMIICDAGSGFITLVIFLLLASGKLVIWEIFLVNFLLSALGILHRLTRTTVTPMLIAKEHLARANGFLQALDAGSQLVSPILAAALMNVIEIKGVILIDFSTYLFAILTLFLIKVPNRANIPDSNEQKTSLMRDILSGWQYLRTRSGLLRLIALFTLGNAFGAFFIVLYTPLVLSFTTTLALGSLSSIGGVGMLLGSLIIGVWGGPKRRMTGVILTSLFECASIILMGVQPSVILVGIGTLLIYINIPINNGLANAVIQSIVPVDRQGRVYGLMQMLGSAVMPLSFLAAGPLMDHVFEPLMATEGALAGNIGKLIGVGHGRGIALAFILLGIIYIVCLAGAYISPRLRSLEDGLPETQEAQAGLTPPLPIQESRSLV